jgi:hypothetical protein
MAVAASAAMSGVVKAGIHSPGSSSFRVGVSLGDVAVAPKWKVGRIGVGRFVASAEEGDVVVVSRRVVMVAGLLASGVGASEARAGVPTYRKYVDRLDGYAFSYPAGWIQVRGAGADIFFRDPVNLDENVLVEMSSPSSRPPRRCCSSSSRSSCRRASASAARPTSPPPGPELAAMAASTTKSR